MDLVKYNTMQTPYTAVGTAAVNIPIDQLCNGYSIKNTGNTILLFRKEPLQPGESKVIGGNFGEINTDRVQISFQEQAVQPLPVVNQAWFTQKIYLVDGSFDSINF
jgi:hypothetical protein